MNPGDTIRMHMHDTPAGFRVDMFDLINRPERLDDRVGGQRIRPHPLPAGRVDMHGEAVRVPPRVLDGYSARQHVVRAHLQRRGCPTRSVISRTAAESTRRATARRREQALTRRSIRTTHFCLPAADSSLVPIDGCVFDDEDFDGQSYRWIGRGRTPTRSSTDSCIRRRWRSPAPTTNNGRTDYSTIAFEADLPRIEADDSQFNPPFCDRTTGANCVNPPAGAQFYPLYTTGIAARWLRLAAGRHTHPRDHKHVRRELHDGVRTVAFDGVPRTGADDRAPVRQLQQRRHAQSLPGLPVWRTTLT